MAFSLSRSFQVAQIQKVTEEVTSSVAQLSSDAEQLLAFVGNDVVASYDTFDEVADAYNQDAGKIDALISDFSATSEELLASIDGVLDAMEGIATATNAGAEGTTDIAPVSYTHLDVYKRQARFRQSRCLQDGSPGYLKLRGNARGSPWQESRSLR